MESLFEDRGAVVTKFTLLASDRVIPLVDGENIAGRGAGCEVVIDSTSVSRRHARFTVLRGTATVEDLGSKNGTFVNRTPVSGATRLNDGDEVALGTAVFKLRRLEIPVTALSRSGG